MTDSNKLLATLFASLMVLSMVAGGASLAAATTGGPSGMTGVPGDNVGPPEQVQGDGPPGDVGVGPPSSANIPTHAAAWDIHADRHAGDLGVEVGETPGGQLALVLSDDVNHDGREVALDASTLEEAVGYRPEVVYGVHETDGEWRSAVEYRDGFAVFDVPKFSSNTVTFGGERTITANPADDGATFEYETSDSEGVSDFTINLTGVDNTRWANQSQTAGDGDTIDFKIGGNADAEGPSANNLPTVTLTGVNDVGPSATSASELWKDVPEGAPNGITATIGPEGAIWVADNNGVLHKYDADSNLQWTETYDGFGIRDVISDDQHIYIALRESESIAKLDTDGSIVWESPTGDVPDQLAESADGSEIYVGTWQSAVEKFDKDGTHVWTASTGATYSDALTAADDGGAYLSDSDDMLYKFGPNGGEDWSVNLGYRAYGLSEIDGLVHVDASSDTEIEIYDSGSLVQTETFGQDVSGELRSDSAGNLYTSEGAKINPDYEIVYSKDTNMLRPQANTDHERLVADRWNGDDTEIVVFEQGDETEDPSVDVNGDGTADVSYTGVLAEGETVTEEVELSTGEQSAAVAVNGIVNVDIELAEVTKTSDPVVELNGQQVATHSGTLADGKTVTVDADETLVENGTNTVNVSVSEGVDGPIGLVGMDYSHTAPDDRSVEYEGEAFSERYSVSKTWAEDTTDATLTIPWASDRVIDVRDVRVQTLENGEVVATDDSPATSNDDGDLVVELGDVQADQETVVTANGSKVRTYAGDINVLEPTVAGDDLATEIEVTSLDDEGRFGIDVSGTDLGDRVHYASATSWSGEEPYAEVTGDGDQFVWAADANVGSTLTLETSTIGVTPDTGAIEVVIEDSEEPRFSLRTGQTTGADAVDVTYTDTLSGERYVLWSVTEEREIDVDRASSPVYFTTDGDSATYTILQRDREGSAVGGSAPASTSSAAPMVLVLPVAGISVAGLFWAGRRFGGARGVRGNVGLLMASTVVSVAAVELVTPGSLLGTIYQSTVFALGDAAAGGIGAMVAALATLVGMWQLNERTERDVPPWVLVPAVSLSIVVALEAIRPGSVLGVLEEVLAEVGALLALILVAFAIYRWRQRNQVEQTEASTPDTEVTLDLGGSTSEDNSEG